MFRCWRGLRANFPDGICRYGQARSRFCIPDRSNDRHAVRCCVRPILHQAEFDLFMAILAIRNRVSVASLPCNLSYDCGIGAYRYPVGNLV